MRLLFISWSGWDDTFISKQQSSSEYGTDFRLTKTTKGQYADYSTSKWARKESALTEEELAAIDTNGLYNLNDFLPTKPSEEGVQATVIFCLFMHNLSWK